MIDVNDIIRLNDNNKYLVVSSINYENNIYLYLVDIINNSNIKFVELFNNQVIEVTDNSILDELLKLIVLNIKD